MDDVLPLGGIAAKLAPPGEFTHAVPEAAPFLLIALAGARFRLR